jgi:cell division septation protein DedD
MKALLAAALLLLPATGSAAQERPGATLAQIYGLPSIPPGYTRVWDDDRLNPNRARGTATGEAQMDAIWTDDVPRQLRPLPSPAAATAPVAVATGTPVVAVQPGYFVQVTTATSLSEANVLAADLRGAGIPARRGELRRGATRTPLVLAGPYASLGAANAGLSEVRRLGYPGAVLRN